MVDKIVNSVEHQQLALDSAISGIVLLQNNNSILPLSLDKLKTIAVIGPCADQIQLGDYSGGGADINSRTQVTLLQVNK
jgi:beta-glucosidase